MSPNDSITMRTHTDRSTTSVAVGRSWIVVDATGVCRLGRFMGFFRELIDSCRSSARSAYFGEVRRQLRAMRAEELACQTDPADGGPEHDPRVEIAPGITSSAYLATSKRRFGTSNPERMRNPIWEWMVRTGNTPFAARRSLGLDSYYRCPGKPEWCFDRMGAARVEMPDGRVITIAGEHEDFYDPDFCIYNDVVVQKGDAVEIYGYPRSVFPPTDFHTATLVGNDIFIVGSLGYHDERGGSRTPVFRLDARSYHIERAETTGESPGWIHKHRARHLPDAGVIEITGGERVLDRGADERFRDNVDDYHLNVRDGVWKRVTDHSDWRQFSLEYADDERAWGDLGWWTGEVLRQLGYPCELYEANDEDEEDEEDLCDRTHVIVVDGVRVLCSDRHREIRVTIQGRLEQSKIDELLSKLKALAGEMHRVVTKIEEL